MSSVPGLLRRAFSGFWSALDTSRRVFFNLIFLIVLAFIIAVIFKGSPRIDEKTVLVLGLTGKLVEQRSGSTREQLLSEVQGGTKEPTQLRDVLAVLDAAAKDLRIERVVLTLDEFDGSGPASLHEVASALERFKDAGKQVVRGAALQPAFLLSGRACQ
ncbi:MAG: hypothetical protein IPP88_18965 [Betaproteobacteria bacterium]|nr:hypothetical protein [Betaproteobacteria bacterium]